MGWSALGKIEKWIFVVIEPKVSEAGAGLAATSSPGHLKWGQVRRTLASWSSCRAIVTANPCRSTEPKVAIHPSSKTEIGLLRPK